jgi:hypothetical protein
MRRSSLCVVRAERFLKFAASALALVFVSTSAGAQTIGEAVEDHLDQNLEKDRPKRRAKKPATRHRTARTARRAEPMPAPVPEQKPKGPDLPARVIGKSLKLDPTIGIGYRGWQPQSYPSLAVRTENALTWQLEMKASFFGLFSLHRGYYESNAVSAPRHSGAVVAADLGGKAPKALWVLGLLGVKIKWVLEPIIRYESRAFESIATPREGRLVRIIPHSASENENLANYPQTNQKLRVISAYETFVVGLRYHHDNDPSPIVQTSSGDFPPIYFGVGVTRYDKPYQVTVGEAVFDDAVFDARFEGIGLAFGLDTNQKPERFYANVATQFGLGRVFLMHDYILNDSLPANWAIGYAQGNFTVGYLHPIAYTMPTPLIGADVSLGGATFFYFKTVREEGETVDTPPLNWDLLWQARAYFTLPL